MRSKLGIILNQPRGLAVDLLAGAGEFPSAAGWALTGSAAIVTSLTMTTGGLASRAIAIPSSGGIYKVTITLISRTAGDLWINFADNAANSNPGVVAPVSRTPGTFTYQVIALPGNTTLRLNGVSGWAGEADNVYVRPA